LACDRRDDSAFAKELHNGLRDPAFQLGFLADTHAVALMRRDTSREPAIFARSGARIKISPVRESIH
jgi:hypothetical protein